MILTLKISWIRDEFPGVSSWIYNRFLQFLAVSLVFLVSGCVEEFRENERTLDGEFWKNQALRDILPYWTRHVRDTVGGAFFTSLDAAWIPLPDDRKYPSMISRHLFSYSVAYMMTGDDKFLQIARDTRDFLLKYGWDQEFGGWYDELDREGNPVSVTKSMFIQVYALTGLSMYYFATHDHEVMPYIQESNHLLESNCWDTDNGGYYQVMTREWQVLDGRKSCASQVAPVSGYLLTLYLATREPAYLAQAERIMDAVYENMRDPESGWILETFDANWTYLPGNSDRANMGHNLEVAWMLMRIALIGDRPDYKPKVESLTSLLHQWAFDPETGMWYATVDREDPAGHSGFTHWWIQAYGNMFELMLYRFRSDNQAIGRFKMGAKCWNTFFIDQKSGDTFLSVNRDGSVRDSTKANRFKTSYHSMEHCFLNFIYLSSWINHGKFRLFFSIDPEAEDDRLYPVPVEDPGIQISDIRWQGEQKKNLMTADREAVIIDDHSMSRISVVLESP